MGLKDILVVIDAGSGGDHAIRFAEQLAQQRAGHVSGLVVGWRPSVPTISEAWVVADRIEKLAEEMQTLLDADIKTTRLRLERDIGSGGVEGLLMELEDARKVIGIRARHADVTVVSRLRPAAADAVNVVIEACLFDSGRPVIVVPPTWKTGTIGRTVLAVWKPTREAARAFADAGPIFASANRVVVATVDAAPTEFGYGEAPGVDICAHLARSGAKVELVNLASGGRTVAEAMQDQALAIGADLIVMGGYGRSRISELILGGVTRDMLRDSPLPILMSH
jgi:nucleotide-binding universal stress UspA family protein